MSINSNYNNIPSLLNTLLYDLSDDDSPDLSRNSTLPCVAPLTAAPAPASRDGSAESPTPLSALAPLPPPIFPVQKENEESLLYVSQIDQRARNYRQLEEYFPNKEDFEAARVASLAIERTCADLVLGSNNREKRAKETNGWIVHANAKSIFLRGQYCNIGWQNYPENGNSRWKIIRKPITYSFNLPKKKYDQLMTLDEVGADLLLAAIAYRDHSANCDGMSRLTLYYLLKSGSKSIKRIERVVFNDEVRHSFLVINRAPNSKIEDINSWGNSAFVVDTWLDDMVSLRIYPQSKASSCLADARKIANYSPYSAALVLNAFSMLNDSDNTSLKLPTVEIPTPSFEEDSAPLQAVIDINPEKTRGLIPDIQDIEVTTLSPPAKRRFQVLERDQREFMVRQTEEIQEQYKSLRAELMAARLEQEGMGEDTPHLARRRAPKFLSDNPVIDFEDIRIPDFNIFDI